MGKKTDKKATRVDSVYATVNVKGDRLLTFKLDGNVT